jgi:hypothetical protein
VSGVEVIVPVGEVGCDPWVRDRRQQSVACNGDPVRGQFVIVDATTVSRRRHIRK